ncbi:MAG: trypsin-like peptidase domain-containing protein [bacterium]|nr:trypsin-like peptidase domain-containing protein [bacterium]MDZ4284383.1 trypsin-like peptidase domain-containing protein [Patescibacteria group bacterium]
MSYYKKTILVSAATSALVLGIVLAALGGYVYLNRGAIFNYFASEILEEAGGEDGDATATSTSGAPVERSGFAKALQSEEERVISAVKRASPAVISIVVSKDVPIIEQYFEEDPFFDFFGDNFGGGFQMPRLRERGTERRDIGSGSGFIIGTDGLAVTNRHVVEDTNASYTAFTNDGKKYDVEVVAKDPMLDIAVIRLKGGGSFPALSFGDSAVLDVGQKVIAIGNALGEFRNTVSVGVISGLARSIVAGDSRGRFELLEEVIQTDAAINPGNSGGPLLNLGGLVIGVNVAVAQGSENIGFALPSNTVASVVESVKTTGKIVRPYLGVRYTMITERIKQANNLTVDYGALVGRGEGREELAVMPGSPADKAGIVENDIILTIDGVKLDENHSLASAIRRKNVGESVTLVILHRGEEKIVRVTLEALPE